MSDAPDAKRARTAAAAVAVPQALTDAVAAYWELPLGPSLVSRASLAALCGASSRSCRTTAPAAVRMRPAWRALCIVNKGSGLLARRGW